MASQWSDLSRPPLSAERLQRALGGDLWRQIDVVSETASTNADLADAARAGEPEGLVLVAEQQTGGRGRLDRQWESPPRAGLTFSVLVRPSLEPAQLSLLPLIAGLAAAEALVAVGGVDARLKWPNDVLVGGRKLGGVLVEVAGGAAVIGIGLNVSMREDELPVATATSLLLCGGSTDREPLLKEVLRALGRRYREWRWTGDSGSVLPAYRERCETIGCDIELELPGGRMVRGNAVGVDDTGRLVVADTETRAERAWLVGDVTHVRKVAP
ncbi:MAG TPA: biotin--[acetyl-CoA-carboxylase] ligase [Mycobacteriales bacterium]|nr:biotin--[acetyl-CoA-carboxylase] ligase [Mycobacteriales bacterium]